MNLITNFINEIAYNHFMMQKLSSIKVNSRLSFLGNQLFQ